jgi:membrane-bound serine protease (ClpP class)
MRFLGSIIVSLAFIWASASLMLQANPAPTWLEVEIGIVGASSTDILESALKKVKKESHAGLIIRLDTPGGQLDATRTMVKEILGANVPVVVWVGPAGARAGSAGAFLTMAGHVAAMAPGTNIGASHPVDASGQQPPSKEMADKITNDTVAFIESIATVRKRNIEMARSFVLTSASITDEEALRENVIDLVASDIPELMGKIHGREVELQSGAKLTLNTQGATIVPYEKSLRQRALEILSNPNLFYLLFLAGIIGLGFELTHPGALFPGIAGGICMILALIAMSVLPVSFGALGLMIIGIALIVAELFVPSFGLLGIGGITAFVLGSVFLVDPSNEAGLRISLFTILPSVVVVTGVAVTIGWLVLKAERTKVTSGSEGLIGMSAEVLQDFRNGHGKVRVAGEIWQATSSAEGIKKGDLVKVLALSGLVVDVGADVKQDGTV